MAVADADAYLLLGVPLTIAFQLVVCRQPLRAVWIRAAPAWRRRCAWAIAAIVLAALPLYELVTGGFVGGNLAIPAAAHALIDAVRNAVLGAG